MSDDSHGMFVKFKRNGTLVWQLGGTNPLGKSFKLVGLTQWTRNHGHTSRRMAAFCSSTTTA